MCPGLSCSCIFPSSSSGFPHEFPPSGWYWSVLESPRAACVGLHRPPLRGRCAGTVDFLAHRQSRLANAPNAPKIRVTSIGCPAPLQFLVSPPLRPICGGPFGAIPHLRCRHHVPCPRRLQAFLRFGARAVRPPEEARPPSLTKCHGRRCLRPVVVSHVHGIHEDVEPEQDSRTSDPSEQCGSRHRPQIRMRLAKRVQNGRPTPSASCTVRCPRSVSITRLRPLRTG